MRVLPLLMCCLWLFGETKTCYQYFEFEDASFYVPNEAG